MQQQCEMFGSPVLLSAEPLAFPLSPPVATWSEAAESAVYWPLSPLAPADLCVARGTYSSSPSSAVSDGSSAPVSLQPPHPSPSPVSAEEYVCNQQSRTSHVPATVEQHRSADARRRRREKTALRRLEELCGSTADEIDEQPSTAAADSISVTVRRKRKRYKQSVLEASAARIERLEQLLRLSELANRMSEARMQQMSDEIEGMVERERQSMLWLATRSLSNAGLLNDRLAFTLIDCRTGRLLKANSAFFNLTGFTPGGTLQRVLDPVLTSLNGQSAQDSAASLADLPLVRAKRRADEHTFGRTTHWVPLHTCRQYPSTLQLLQDLLEAQLDNCRAPFRCRWSDGYAYEIQALFWPVDVEWVQREDGSRWRRTLSLMVSASIDECCRVEEED